MKHTPSTAAKSFTFRNPDGTYRRSVSRRSPAAVYDRLGRLGAVEGMDEILLLGQWFSISPSTPALIGAILAA